MADACVQQMHRLATSAKELLSESVAHDEIDAELNRALKGQHARPRTVHHLYQAPLCAISLSLPGGIGLASRTQQADPRPDRQALARRGSSSEPHTKRSGKEQIR